MIKASVIIPINNSEKFLERCLNSVFSQDCIFDFEVICAIEPSTDKSLQILTNFRQKHQNLVILEEPAHRFPLTRIDASLIAKGEYICFLDSDDYYPSNHLSVLVNEIEKGYDIVVSSFYNDRDGKIKKNEFAKRKILTGRKASKMLLNDMFMRGFLWNKIYPRKLFTKNTPVPKMGGLVFEDFLLNYFFFMNSKKIKMIKEPLYYYRCNPKSTTKKENVDRFINHLSVFAFIRYLCEKNEDKHFLKDFRATRFRSYMSLAFDIQVSKHVLGYGWYKGMNKNSHLLKNVFGRKPFVLEDSIFEKFVKDCLKPLN